MADEEGVLTLDDVRKASPAEDPEEKRVMDFLERSNVTGRSSKFFDAATSIHSDILSQVSTKTDEFADSRERDENKTDSDEKAVGDELFDITNLINRLHYEMQTNQAIDTSSGDNRNDTKVIVPGRIFQGKEDAPQSEGDRFAANAGKLFKGYSKREGFFRRKKAEESSQVPKTHGDIEAQHSNLKLSSHFSKRMKIASIESLQEFKTILSAKKGYAWTYARDSLFFIIIPSTIIAAILFYLLGNPEFGESLSVEDVTRYFNAATVAPSIVSGEPTPAPSIETIVDGFDPSNCSYWKGVKGPTLSWWILFLGVRQVIVLGLARGLQYVVIYYALKINVSCLMGPTIRLFLLQARGWPFEVVLWSALNFALLFGDRRFSKHWMYYQDWIELFNECNPAGTVTSNSSYGGLLVYAIFLGVLVALKRFWMGLRFGKASYLRYGEKLSQILKDQLLLSKVAQKARFEYYSEMDLDDVDEDSVLGFWSTAGQEEQFAMGGLTMEHSPGVAKKGKRHKRTYTSISVDSANFLTKEQNEDIAELLGEWEDLELSDGTMDNEADLSAIIQFRASLGVLESNMPYSPAFGNARTRKQVIEGSERLYDSLVKKQQFLDSSILPSHVPAPLRFHTIALTALSSTGRFDRARCKSLMKLFRPGRDGSISKLEFCKSIDSQYKELRKLRASIVNEGKVNIASERIINFLFYGVMLVVGLGVLGIDPVALFGVMTSFLLGFSFMIGGASSDVFRGLLFITLQRPYDIGDRVNVNSAAAESSPSGSSGWIVKDITLYHTTFVYGTTNEYATVSNGALSNARIINAARSPLAVLNFGMKFGLDLPASTIEVFKEELTAYIKARPREWLSFNAFRMTKIEANSGFVEYKIVVQHRESWQQVGALLNSLAELQAFAFERSRDLNMTYKSPCMPVELKMLENQGTGNLSLPPLSAPANRNRERTATEPTAPSSPFRQALFGNRR